MNTINGIPSDTRYIAHNRINVAVGNIDTDYGMSEIEFYDSNTNNVLKIVLSAENLSIVYATIGEHIADSANHPESRNASQSDYFI